MKNGTYAWPAAAACLLGGASVMVGGPIPTNEGVGPVCAERPLSSDRFIVDEDATNARAAVGVDIDGDDDTDLVVVSFLDGVVAWHENDGENPPSFTKHVIDDGANGAQGTFATDLDDDDDTDILVVSFSSRDVQWYENDGQDPPSFTRRLIVGNASNPFSVYATDIAGDTGVDFVTGNGSGLIDWYENEGGDPATFTRRNVKTAAGFAFAYAADINGDTDVDVIGAYQQTIEWYENNGGDPPTWTTHDVGDVGNASGVFAIDLDGDDDNDILASSGTQNHVVWFENDGEDPPGFTPRTISADSANARSVSAADLDGDTNIDVLTAYAGSLAWFQSDGGDPPAFTKSVIDLNAGQPQMADPADIDGDLDTDVLTASAADNTVSWYALSEPAFGTCCLSDGTCLDGLCLADCASMLAWQWIGGATCGDITCPGGDTPSQFLVDRLEFDRFEGVVCELADFETRYYNREGNDLATEYIRQKLMSYGYTNVTLDPYMFGGLEKFNVYATKIGTKRPDEMYILGAHFDSFNINQDNDHAPGADDDGSGTSSVLELARVFSGLETDVSIRFCLWNNEETGLNGSSAYVENHKDLQGTEGEPTWIAMIQQDMIMYDRFQTPDADVEWQADAPADGAAVILAQFVAGAMGRYGDIPAQASDNMRNTDSVPFMQETVAISARENTRDEIGAGSNPNWHQATDRCSTYTETDFLHGFNICKMIGGAIGESVNARDRECPADIDGDGLVGFADLLRVLSAWDNEGGPEDVDNSGLVDFTDLLRVLSAWGPCKG